MQAFYQLPAPGTIAQIQAQLPLAIPYTTLASRLKSMRNKWYVRIEQRGRHRYYSPRFTGKAYGCVQVRQLVLRGFAGSYPALVAFCIHQGPVTYAEAEANFCLLQANKSL